MRAVVLGGGARNNNPKIEHANVTTTTRRQPPTVPARPALHSRDQNVMMRTAYGSTPLTARSGNANMPPSHDKQQNGARPLAPTLGPGAAKMAGKIPLTPRVAQSNVPTTSTPVPRRTARFESVSPLPSSRDDFTSPAPTFLSQNITPRSGSRKTRLDSANNTPTGTPNGAQGTPSGEGFRSPSDNWPGSGFTSPGVERDTTRRAAGTFSPDELEGNYQRLSPNAPVNDSKFFFASDARTAAQPPNKRPISQSKGPTFFYASGESIPAPNNQNPTVISPMVNDERSQAKFFHANGTPDVQASPSPQFPPSRPSSAVSSASRMVGPPRLTSTKPTPSQPQRPPSPHKLGLGLHASTPPLRSPGLAPLPASHPQNIELAQSMNNILQVKRLSAEKESLSSRDRSSSASSNFSMSPPVKSPTQSIQGEAAVPMTPGSLSIVLPVATTPEEKETQMDGTTSGLQSPIKAGHSLERMNELAATARQERKVLDLEITNSSLAAINRALEREMRKQSAELRRYRRLSRSGRLSIATNTSMRTSSIGSLSIMDGMEGTMLSDMSEEEEDNEEDDYESSEDSVDDSTLSPQAIAERDLKHREKDEKRLQLDLSKHQQLLIDSQKLNQSLKRCLGWTEELIKEGKKALTYNVRVSDVELGGRVLSPDEVEGFHYELEPPREEMTPPWANEQRFNQNTITDIHIPNAESEPHLYETPSP